MGLVPSLGSRGSSAILNMSWFLMGKGLTQKNMVSLAIERVYKNLALSGYDNFEHFHASILSIFETANSALPGRHFEAPSRGKVKKAHEGWKSASIDDQKKEIFTKLLEGTELGQIDKVTLIVGLATPPFSMVAKRAGENAPPFKMIKKVPDFLLVPSVTVLSLFSVKLIRKALEKHREDKEDETMAPT